MTITEWFWIWQYSKITFTCLYLFKPVC